MNGYRVRLYTDNTVKPVAVLPQPIVYAINTRVDDVIESMIKKVFIEKLSPNEPTPWISCALIVPKSDSFLRINLDTRNLNKVLISNNYPISRQEVITALLSSTDYLSKLHFKSAFWQLKSRTLTRFHANNKLYQYTRLIMGVRPAQAKLNAALKPIFSQVPKHYLIFDEGKKEKEECHNNLWKKSFDYISQNVEYDKEIIDTHQQQRRSQRIRKPNLR